jgi:uncharacterized protein RhaS with RHS repeats
VYDANGNMTTRVENNVTYLQGWNVENRLTSVTVNGLLRATTFYYDGDALRERVKKVDSTDATAHIVLTPPRIPDTIETVPDINRSEEPPMLERGA